MLFYIVQIITVLKLCIFDGLLPYFIVLPY
jgi:hypothetical protein